MTIDGVKTIGLVGAGNIGSQIARAAIACGYAAQITTDGTPPGTRIRRALAIAGDDLAAKAQVVELIDGFGFDVVDIGPLAESWRIQPGRPGYVKRLDAAELTAALASVKRR